MPRRDSDEWFWKVGSDLKRLSEEMRRSGPTIASGRCWEPRVDLFEDENHLIAKAEIAGVKGDEIGLIYLPERHSLVIRGQRTAEDTSESNRLTGFYQLEIYYGEFEREIKLPDIAVQADGIRAHYRNGFLTVLIPKANKVIVEHTVTIEKV